MGGSACTTGLVAWSTVAADQVPTNTTVLMHGGLLFFKSFMKHSAIGLRSWQRLASEQQKQTGRPIWASCCCYVGVGLEHLFLCQFLDWSQGRMKVWLSCTCMPSWHVCQQLACRQIVGSIINIMLLSCWCHHGALVAFLECSSLYHSTIGVQPDWPSWCFDLRCVRSGHQLQAQ